MKLRLLLFSFLVLCGSTLSAQLDIRGTITDTEGEPLIGAAVVIKGTTNGASTDLDGVFSISSPDNEATLIISYLGYETKEVMVDADNTTLTIILELQSTTFDEVVITGLASSVKRSNLANSVASVPASEISGVSVPTTTDAALYGRFKGANISAASGAPGGGLSIKLRGTTSINGSSQPLIIMDGVYIDNSSIPAGLNVVSRAAGGGSQSNQDNPSNRLADIDPFDIESIEILKGASAAAIYGSRAAGGVVIITTKKGTPGDTKVKFSQSFGWNEMLNPLGSRNWTEEKVLASGFADDVDAFRAARDAGQLRDYEQELFGNKGLLVNSRLSISGGNDKTRFYVAGSFKDEEGIVNNTGYEKNAVRMNLDHEIADWLDFSANLFYVNSSADRGFFNNDNSGTTMGVAFTSTPSWAQLLPDENGVYPENPYAPSNFIETAAKVTNNERVNRLIGGGQLTARILSTDNQSLRLMVRGGRDYYDLNTQAIFPNDLQFQKVANGGLNGVAVQGNTVNENTNLAAFMIHTYITGNNITFRSQAGITAENFNQNTILGTSFNLIEEQTNLDLAGSRDIVQNRLIQKDRGFFIQEEVNFQDKIIATVGLRADKSSNNGDANELFYYPKASVAANLHNFFDLSDIGSVKVRAAYGQSGNFAAFGSKTTTFNSSILNGLPGIVVNNQQGNPGVSPERQTELEFGVDVGVLNQRILFDATYYIKKVEDLLVFADVPPSSGFTSQVTNAAELENTGLELGVSAQVLRNADWKYDTRLSFWTNTSEVTSLGIPSYTTGGFADFLGQFRIMEGRSPTEIIGVGPDGLTVYGDAEPDFQMSWNNNLSWRNFDLSFLWHWKQGGEVINLSALLFDLNETTFDFDDFGLDPSGEMANGPYRLSQLGSNTEPYIEEGTYFRLRNIGLYYRIPRSVFKDVVGLKVGFSGTNIFNSFKYNSYDPEVSNFGTGGLSTSVEVLPFPSAKRFNFHVIAEF